MPKTKRQRIVLTPEEKLYRARCGLFILHLRQQGMGNREMREILGGDQAEIDAVAKVVNKGLRRAEKKNGK
jgi:hypothetical protein